MTTIPKTIEHLITCGESPARDIADLESGPKLGLWTHSPDGARAVATPALMRLWGDLPDVGEAVAGVFACESRYRNAWLTIAAARLKEYGQRRDAAELCRLIEGLGPASESVLGVMPGASLSPTGFADLETELLGAPAEQAVAVPALFRALSATADIVEGGRGGKSVALPSIVPLDPQANWVDGRLMRLPDADEPAPVGVSSVLSGSLAPLGALEREKDAPPDQDLMRWVVIRPWAILLAQVVFTQDAWRAERISGGLRLELDDAQLDRFFRPWCVNVVVSTPQGDEVACGCLGELVQRVLAILGVTLIAPGGKVDDMDNHLAAVINELLERKVWRFEGTGAAGSRPGYMIHPEFSNACYRAFGSRHFYRLGSRLTGAVREACELWAYERLGRPRPEIGVTR